MHELEKYWTLSQYAETLGVSIPRIKRLFVALHISTHTIGAAIVADKKHEQLLRKALRDKLIRRGRTSQKNGR